MHEPLSLPTFETYMCQIRKRVLVGATRHPRRAFQGGSFGSDSLPWDIRIGIGLEGLQVTEKFAIMRRFVGRGGKVGGWGPKIGHI